MVTILNMWLMLWNHHCKQEMDGSQLIHLLLLPLLLLFHCCYLANSVFDFCYQGQYLVPGTFSFRNTSGCWLARVLLTGTRQTQQTYLLFLKNTLATASTDLSWVYCMENHITVKRAMVQKKLYCSYAVEKSHKSHNKLLVQEQSRHHQVYAHYDFVHLGSVEWVWIQVQHSVSFSSDFGLHQQK